MCHTRVWKLRCEDLTSRHLHLSARRYSLQWDHCLVIEVDLMSHEQKNKVVQNSNNGQLLWSYIADSDMCYLWKKLRFNSSLSLRYITEHEWEYLTMMGVVYVKSLQQLIDFHPKERKNLPDSHVSSTHVGKSEET